MAEGRLHSIETMGLVDGPGIRTVFFLQGCPLRCAYCHNPDTQSMFSKEQITPEEVVKTALRYKSYYNQSGGGVTFSGGEPLLQGEFLLESLKLLKEAGIHTAIDTCGYGDERYFKEILKYVDTIILDIKHFNNEGYKKITKRSMQGFYKFLSYLEDFRGILWIRHVMVPSITDHEKEMLGLFQNIAHLANKIQRFEVLPYHKLGLEKYEMLNMEYTMKDIPEMDKDRAKELENFMVQLLDNEKESINISKDII